MGVMMDTVLMMWANDEWSVFLLRIPPSVFVSYLEVCRNATNANFQDQLVPGNARFLHVVFWLWSLGLELEQSRVEDARDC
jgi:hypothetical protein